MGLELIVGDLNAISETTVILLYPDGLERGAFIMLACTIQDQVEMDELCCKGLQLCKQCSCPKDLLHKAYARFPPRDPAAMEKAMRNAALHGLLPGDRGLPSLSPLFTLGTDPKSKRPRWFPTRACTTKVYDETRKKLGGTHLV